MDRGRTSSCFQSKAFPFMFLWTAGLSCNLCYTNLGDDSRLGNLLPRIQLFMSSFHTFFLVLSGLVSGRAPFYVCSRLNALVCFEPVLSLPCLSMRCSAPLHVQIH